VILRSLTPRARTSIRTKNFEEREKERGYLDRAVLEYMKEQQR